MNPIVVTLLVSGLVVGIMLIVIGMCLHQQNELREEERMRERMDEWL